MKQLTHFAKDARRELVKINVKPNNAFYSIISMARVASVNKSFSSINPGILTGIKIMFDFLH